MCFDTTLLVRVDAIENNVIIKKGSLQWSQLQFRGSHHVSGGDAPDVLYNLCVDKNTHTILYQLLVALSRNIQEHVIANAADASIVGMSLAKVPSKNIRQGVAQRAGARPYHSHGQKTRS